MNAFGITFTRREAHRPRTFEDVEIDDLVSNEHSEINRLIKLIANPGQKWARTLNQSIDMPALERHKSDAEPIARAAQIAFDKAFGFQHLEIAMGGTLRQFGGRCDLDQSHPF